MKKITLDPYIAFFGGACGRAVTTSNFGSGGPGFKPRLSRCFPR